MTVLQNGRSDRAADAAQLDRLARAVAALGPPAGLPYVAAVGDMANAAPLLDLDGQPYATTVFPWLDPTYRYWQDREIVLRLKVLQVARSMAEPFYMAADGRLRGWRRFAALEAAGEVEERDLYGVAALIVVPVRLPYAVTGAILWASPRAPDDLHEAFLRHADAMHLAALRFLSLHGELTRPAAQRGDALSRREVQCLKWIAAGKTDAEVAAIVGISASTVRFHMRNACSKLNVTSRAQAVRAAAALGYLGAAGGA